MHTKLPEKLTEGFRRQCVSERGCEASKGEFRVSASACERFEARGKDATQIGFETQTAACPLRPDSHAHGHGPRRASAENRGTFTPALERRPGISPGRGVSSHFQARVCVCVRERACACARAHEFWFWARQRSPSRPEAPTGSGYLRTQKSL